MLKKIIIYILSAQLILLFFFNKYIPDDNFYIYFLDVGQGDSIFVKTPENHQILIDAGPGPKVVEELNKLIPFFDRTLDLIVITHPHKDHYMGFLEILNNYDVDRLLFNAVNTNDESYLKLLEKIKKNNIEISIANQKNDFLFKNVLLDIIYPFKSLALQSLDNINNSSIVLNINYKNKNILLTGDIEEDVENLILNKNISADILKVPHHGSKSSSSLNFINKVNPEIAIIQNGKNNKFGHPHLDTLKVLSESNIKIMRNDQEGTIGFTF